jgi:hypothetical protein
MGADINERQDRNHVAVGGNSVIVGRRHDAAESVEIISINWLG